MNVRYDGVGNSTVEPHSATLILAGAAAALDPQVGDIHTRSSCYAAAVSRMTNAASPSEWERLMRPGADQARALADFEAWFQKNQARLRREAESERPAYEAARQTLDAAALYRKATH